MNTVMLFLHILGAAGLGFYLVLPFLIGRATRLAGTGQEGLAEGLAAGNRIAQYFLVVQLLTGGYLVSQAEYSVLWMVVSVILFIAIAAFGGILSKPLKRIASSIREGQSATEYIKRAQTLSTILLVLVAVILYVMQNPQQFQ